MIKLKKKGESKYWLLLTLFILILIISCMIIVNNKKALRVDRFNRHLNSDMLFLKDHVSRELQIGDYTNIDSFLKGWAELHFESIKELKLSTPNGFILSHLLGETASPNIAERSLDIEYSYTKRAILHVKFDMSVINDETLHDYITLGFVLFFVSLVLIYITRIALKRRSTVFKLEKQAVELRKISSAVEQSPSSIVVTDINGDIEYVNPKFSQLTGYSVEETIGQNPRILKSGRSNEDDYKNLWDTILRGEIWHGEFLNKKKNGDLYWEDAAIGPIKDVEGSITHFIAIKEDITEKKRINKELEKYQRDLEILVKERTLELEEIAEEMKESQQALMYLVEDANESRTELESLNKKMNRSLKKIESAKDQIDGILKSVADGLIVTDFENKIILMNHIAEELFKTKAEDVSGKPLDSFIKDKDLLEKFSIAFADSEYGHNFDFKISSENTRDNNIYNARVTTIWDKNGVVTGLITTIRDVTREREIDRMKTEFISTSAHELRTPLTSIQGFSEILLTRKNLKKDERKKFLKYINKQSISLGNIINDLLDVSKIESGIGFIIKNEKCNSGDILRSVVNNFKDIYKKHTFKIELSSGLVEIYIDKELIKQAFSNLLSNAVKYSPDGCEILISTRISEGNYIVSVYDEGIGMTPEQLDKIFEKFYRADSTNTAIEGTGLGMGIVKGIVDSHGGEIWVDSESGKWTRVTFSIPLQGKKEKTDV